MADIFLKTKICGLSYLDLHFLEHHYKNFKFYVMSNLIADSITKVYKISKNFLFFYGNSHFF